MSSSCFPEYVLYHELEAFFQVAVCIEKKKKISSMEVEFLHVGGRMQSVAWDSQRPPRVTN